MTDFNIVLQVEIDLDLNAYANARAHFENRKAKAAKQQKTVEQNAKALLAAEKTAQQKLTQVCFPLLSQAQYSAVELVSEVSLSSFR